jgi:hypothetical protein
MAFIIKGGVIEHPKPKVKRFLAIGPGPSTIDLLSRPLDLAPDIITIGLHRVFPLFDNKTGRTLDYWTWGDPHGAVEGLTAYEKLSPGSRPKIIVPHWMKTISSFSKHSGTSPLTMGPKDHQNTYHRVIDSVKDTDDFISIDNAVTTKLIPKDHSVFKNIGERFRREYTYFSSAPFDGILSKSNWPSENKLTSLIFPICHYLGADEVYCIGFDNKGAGIQRKLNVPFTDGHKSKIKLWTDTWQPYHKMKIYNLSPPKFSPNHTFMETVSIDSILKK